MLSPSLKKKTASTLKWTTVDKLSTQVLYAVTGIILANVLSKEAFGLVGAAMIFQAFAMLLVDSGFANALVQRRAPTRTDYSTVFWFNLGMACAIYAALYALAPLIAKVFGGDPRLVPICRVMFLSLILTSLYLVQHNIRVKQMDVKMIAVANALALGASAVVGIWSALAGHEAWAIVWQNLTLAAVKSLVLWTSTRWRPALVFSMQSLRSIFKVGMGVMGTATLNTIFQNIYGLIIGNRAGLVPLGYYTQADKWSKMGVSSLTQIFNTAFLPLLSEFQDDRQRFAATVAKINRLMAYLLFPAMAFLAVMAAPIFHALFGTKWDPAIPLFQLLLLRGVFVVLSGQYTQYFLALARTKLMVQSEALRDGLALAGIAAALPWIAISSPANITEGLQIFLWWQVGAYALSWAIIMVKAAHACGHTAWQFIGHLAPYAVLAVLSAAPMALLLGAIANPWLLLLAQGAAGAAVYLGANALLGSKIQKDIFENWKLRI